jgi:hypothetical protein
MTTGTLQAETNPPSAGLGTNWTVVASSTATNQVSFPKTVPTAASSSV